MILALRILGWWVVLSCTIGPCLTWLFFYGERESGHIVDRDLAARAELQSIPAPIFQELFQ